MKDNQKKYLDRVVDLIVRDTRIDYEKEKVYPPFVLFHTHLSSPPSHYSFLSYSRILSSNHFLQFFSRYCKDTYGLGEEEIDYVWDQYKGIILDKINE